MPETAAPGWQTVATKWRFGRPGEVESDDPEAVELAGRVASFGDYGLFEEDAPSGRLERRLIELRGVHGGAIPVVRSGGFEFTLDGNTLIQMRMKK